MPDEKTDKKPPDAILCSRSLIRGAGAVERSLWVNKVIGPILGVKHVHASQVTGNQVFLRGELHAKDAKGNPDHSEPYGQDHYEWVETPEGSGVMYGTLKPNPLLDEEPNVFGA